MLTALIIVSIAFILLFFIFLDSIKVHRESIKTYTTLLINMNEDEKEHNEYIIKCEVSKAVRYAYGISGDIIHHLSEIVGKEIKYIDLIEKLGEYARSMFLYEKPLSCIEHSVLSDENYLFPQLNKEESKELLEFLTEIHDGKRTPDALLELISGLIFSDSYEESIQRARYWGISKKENNE